MENLVNSQPADSRHPMSFTHTKHVLFSPQSADATLPIDTQIPLPEVTEIRGSDDIGYTRTNSELREEDNGSCHDLRVSTEYPGISKRPSVLRGGRNSGKETGEKIPRPKYVANQSAPEKDRLSMKAKLDTYGPVEYHLLKPECNHKSSQPSTSSSSDMFNDGNWSQSLDEYILQRRHGRNINLSAPTQFAMCWPPPLSYGNITVDFHTPLIFDPKSNFNHNVDTESEASFFPGSEIADLVPDDDAKQSGSYNIPKMPGTCPSSPQKYRPGSQPLFFSSKLGAAQLPSQSQLFADVCSRDTPKFLSNNEVKMNGVGGAQSKGDVSPPRRPKYVYEPRDYSLRPREPWEFPDPFPLTHLQGVPAANWPDASQRIFSTARVQNETADEFRARRRRRKHVIDEEDFSDEDWDAQGEPKKILRLHYQELKNKGNEWEPLTNEKAGELMARGRVDKYCNVRILDTTEIEVCKRKQLETYKRRKYENEPRKTPPSSSSSNQFSEPHNDSKVNEGTELNIVVTVPPPTSGPKPSRGSRVRVNGRLLTNAQKEEREKSSSKIVADLRHLQYESEAIMQNLWNNSQINGDKTLVEQMKRELQDIRNKAVFMEIPATEDDRHRAARLILDIIDSNMRPIANGFGADDKMNSSRWFSHNRYTDYEGLKKAIEIETDQLKKQMLLVSRDSDEYKFLKERREYLEDEDTYLEKREDFYAYGVNDDNKWCNDHENHNPPLMPGDPRVSAEYGAAIGNWNSQASPQTLKEEEEDLEKAIMMSLGEMGQVGPAGKDISGRANDDSAAQSTKLTADVLSQAHWKDSKSIAQFQDDSMDEAALFEKTRAISLALYQNESPPLSGDEY
ncbi:hypothetical protein ACHAQE_005087 [Botrytis cinerea]